MEMLASQSATLSQWREQFLSGRVLSCCPLAPALPTVQPHSQLGLITKNKSCKKPPPWVVFSPSKAWFDSCCSCAISDISMKERTRMCMGRKGPWFLAVAGIWTSWCMKLHFFCSLTHTHTHFNKTQSSSQSSKYIVIRDLFPSFAHYRYLQICTCVCNMTLRMAHGGAKQTLWEWDATTFQMSREQNSVALEWRQIKEVRWPTSWALWLVSKQEDRLPTECKLQLIYCHSRDDAKWNYSAMVENRD